MVRQLVLEKEKSEFKPVKLRLKIDLVSYPVRAEALVNMFLSSCLSIIFSPFYTHVTAENGNEDLFYIPQGFRGGASTSDPV